MGIRSSLAPNTADIQPLEEHPPESPFEGGVFCGASGTRSRRDSMTEECAPLRQCVALESIGGDRYGVRPRLGVAALIEQVCLRLDEGDPVPCTESVSTRHS